MGRNLRITVSQIRWVHVGLPVKDILPYGHNYSPMVTVLPVASGVLAIILPPVYRADLERSFLLLSQKERSRTVSVCIHRATNHQPTGIDSWKHTVTTTTEVLRARFSLTGSGLDDINPSPGPVMLNLHHPVHPSLNLHHPIRRY